jgi:outer membrane protein assembly factor BamB
MSGRRLEFILPAVIAAAGVAALAVWLHATRTEILKPRLPGQEESLGFETKSAAGAGPINSGTTIAGPGAPSLLTGSWPAFRGADRTNIVREPLRLARAWPEGGPKVLWKLPVGEGHAGAAIANGCVYLVDYDSVKKEDAVRCLSLDDAREIWRYTYSVKVLRNHGMSRTVPAVNDRFVVSLGPMCHVTCLEARTGKLVWKFDLVKQFGATVPPWYAGQCPIIDGDAVILAPGGDPLMMAVELASGRVLWRTPNAGGWGMTHSSIMPMDYHGQRQYIYCTTGGVVGVSASDGQVLWRKPDWKIALAMVPSPLVIDGERVFFSGGYNNGSVMVRIKGDGGRLETEELFRLKVAVFGADQQTPILYDGHIYGITPPGELACLDLDGRRLWSSAPRRFGLGPFILADGLLFALNDEDGTLHVAQASPSGYQELASAKLLEGNDAWGPIAVAAGRLILRDLTTMVCVELPKEAS